MNKAELIRLAEDWAVEGFYVFPCTANKRPATGEGGFKNATNDPARVRDLFQGGAACVGVWPGPSGHVVIDVDVKEGKVGEESLQALQTELGSLPDTYTVRTPSGGRHLFFRKTDVLQKVANNELAPDIDVRSDGGYIVAYGPPPRQGLPALPEAYAELLNTNERGTREGTREDLPEKTRLCLELLEKHGWGNPVIAYGKQSKWAEFKEVYYVKYLTRPGKDGGNSASIGQVNDGVLYIHTTSDSTFEANKPYDYEQVVEILGTSQTYSDEDIVTFDEIEEEEVSWLWHNHISLGKLCIVEGDPDHGKSTLTLDVVARTTRGRDWPDGSKNLNGPMCAIIVSAEDALRDTIIPRLRAAGADLKLITSVPVRRNDKGQIVPMTIPDDLDRMAVTAAKMEKRTGCPTGIIVLDPLTAFLSERINSHNDASIRKALAPLGETAEKIGAAVVSIRHLNKQGDLKALYRGGGSIAFTGAARVTLVVGKHPQDESTKVLATVKNNLAEDYVKEWSLTYHLESSDDGTQPVVAWGDRIQMTADELAKGKDGRTEAPKTEECINALREIFSQANVTALPAKQAKSVLKQEFSQGTINRAKTTLGIVTKSIYKDGKISGWEWHLPAKEKDEWTIK